MTNLVRYAEQSNSYILNINSIESNGYYFPAKQAGNGRAVDWAGIGFNDDDNECYPRNTGGNDGVRFSGNGARVILNQNSCVSDVFYSSGNIYFKASGVAGNAKISLTNNGTIVWTWHIWCTSEPAQITVGSYKLLDRNLGAITKNAENLGNDIDGQKLTGLYYTYGSPIGYTLDEFRNGVVYTDSNTQMWSMKQAFQHPNQPFLRDKGGLYMPFNPYAASDRFAVWARIWGNGGAKTCYDPCPSGYKITPYDFWNNFTPPYADYYGVYSGSSGTGAFFPYNGRAYQEGIQTSDIILNGTTYYNVSTRGYRTYMWTASSVANADNAWYYHVRKSSSATYNTAMADEGVSADILTRGMGVRCVYEW